MVGLGEAIQLVRSEGEPVNQEFCLPLCVVSVATTHVSVLIEGLVQLNTGGGTEPTFFHINLDFLLLTLFPTSSPLNLLGDFNLHLTSASTSATLSYWLLPPKAYLLSPTHCSGSTLFLILISGWSASNPLVDPRPPSDHLILPYLSRQHQLHSQPLSLYLFRHLPH